MNVNPGELDKRIQIINKAQEMDADGYCTETETVVHSCFAKFSQTSGSELVKNNADFANLKVRFLIRYTSKTISRKMLVRYGGEDYEIEYLNGYGDSKEYVEIWCSKLTQGGVKNEH